MKNKAHIQMFLSFLFPSLWLNGIFFEVFSNPDQMKSSNFFDANHWGCPLLICVRFKHIIVMQHPFHSLLKAT